MAAFGSPGFLTPSPALTNALGGLSLNTNVPKAPTVNTGGVTGYSPAAMATPAYNPLAPIKTNQGAAFPAPTSSQLSVMQNPGSQNQATDGSKSFNTPNGGTITTDASGNVTNFQQAPGYKIDTGSGNAGYAFPSNALNNQGNFQGLTDTRNQYADYLQGLAQATQPNQQYIDALTQYKNSQLAGQQIQADFLTNPSYPGDTYGFAQGVAGRQTALNSLQQTAAGNNLAVQEAIRSGNIDAYKALVAGTAPQTLGYGQQLTSPLGGAPIATGQTQPSYSAIASPFGGYLSYDQRTGQYTQIGAGDISGGGGGSTGTFNGDVSSLPTFIQPAVGNIAGANYIDESMLTPQQIPYAQQISAQSGIPLLSKDDVNKVQDANTTYQSGLGLINNVASLASSLITATTPVGAVAQAAKLNAQALIGGTQAKLYSDARNGFLSLITRAAGEKGTLAEGDVARIQAALPSFSDTQQTAATKLQTLQQIFSSALKANISSQIGSKVAGNQATGSGGGTGDNSVNIGGSNFVLQNGKWVVSK